MRTIKFRAWDKKNKWMIEDFDNWIDFDGDYWTTPDTVYNTPNQEIVRQKNIILLQFTGLKDKNGKEIYEGDLVKWGNRAMEVKFHHSGFWMFNPKSKDGLQFYNYPHRPREDAVEVVGNIYENPNLLKKGKHDQ